MHVRLLQVIHLIKDKADHERISLHAQNYIPSRPLNESGQGFSAERAYNHQATYSDHRNFLNGTPAGYTSSFADRGIASQDQRHVQDYRPDYGASAYGQNEPFAQTTQAGWSDQVPFQGESNGGPISYGHFVNQGHYSQPFSSDVLSGAADYYTTSEPNHAKHTAPATYTRQNTAVSYPDIAARYAFRPAITP